MPAIRARIIRRRAGAAATITIDAPTGTVLAKRYRLEQVIGSGGYASVYRATDLTLGYERAIKEVSDPDPGVRNQFRLEAELLINSKHPNIPHGYHLIEDRDRLYLIMDYVHGKDLEELLNDSLTQRSAPGRGAGAALGHRHLRRARRRCTS